MPLESDTRTCILSEHSRSVLAVLAHALTSELLCVIGENELDVSTLAARLELDTSLVSHHLRRLHSLELVEFRVHSRRHIYRLTSKVRVHRSVNGTVIQLVSHGDVEIRLVPTLS